MFIKTFSSITDDLERMRRRLDREVFETKANEKTTPLSESAKVALNHKEDILAHLMRFTKEVHSSGSNIIRDERELQALRKFWKNSIEEYKRDIQKIARGNEHASAEFESVVKDYLELRDAIKLF
jgi:hypothetical protein